jgi:DNA-binding LacI/PurR family transcriptional regulator
MPSPSPAPAQSPAPAHAPTIKDIAARAGVSISTVHYALRRTRPISDETRQRVLSAIEELDYHPHAGAATLPSGRTGRLAVVIGGLEPAFANTYFSDFIRGLAAAAEEEDHNVVLYTAYGKRAAGGWRPAHILRRREADGLLLLGTQIDEAHLAELADQERPCVLLNRDHPDLPWVMPDREQGTRQAAAHLLAHGYRRLGLLAADYPGGMPVAGRAELAGFRGAHLAAGRRFDESLVSFTRVAGDPGAATTGLLRRLLAGGDERPGLVIFSYTLAPAACRAVEQSGLRVPDELAIVVGDDDPDVRATLDVPATTVQAPKFEMARAAVRLLLRLIRGERVPPAARRQRFPMELKVRWSCGARQRGRWTLD